LSQVYETTLSPSKTQLPSTLPGTPLRKVPPKTHLPQLPPTLSKTPLRKAPPSTHLPRLLHSQLPTLPPSNIQPKTSAQPTPPPTILTQAKAVKEILRESLRWKNTPNKYKP